MARHSAKNSVDLSRELRDMPDETLLIRWQVLSERARLLLHDGLRRHGKYRDLKLRQYMRMASTSRAFHTEITRRMTNN